MYLVIDVGGQSCRGILFDAQQICIDQYSVSIRSAYIEREQEASGLNESCVELLPDFFESALQEILSYFKVSENDYSLLLICQRASFIACRQQDLSPLSNVISWQDSRNSSLVESLRPYWTQFKKRNGLMPSAFLGFSKMTALLNENKAVEGAAERGELLFLPLSSWLANRVFSKKPENSAASVVCDASCAQRVGLLNMTSLEWDSQLLSLLELDKNLLPNVIQSNEFDGIFESLKFCGGDQSFLPYAFHEHLRSQSAIVNLGTGAFMLAEFDAEAAIDERLQESISLDSANVFVEATINSAASLIEYLLDDSGLTLKFLQDLEVLQDLESLQDIPICINAHAGLGSPHWYSGSELYFIPDDIAWTVTQKVRAALESIVFLLQDNLNLMPGRQYILLSGGLSRLDLINQLIADLSGKKVVRVDEKELSASAALSAYLDAPIYNEWHQIGQVFHPQENVALKRRYELFKLEIEALLDSKC